MEHRRGVAARIVRKPADKAEVFQSSRFERALSTVTSTR